LKHNICTQKFNDDVYFVNLNKIIEQKGIECCSDSFISFHKMSPTQIERLGKVIKLSDSNMNSGSNHRKPLTFREIYNQYSKMKSFL